MAKSTFELIPQIIKFAESIQEYLRIVQAFFKGYDRFMSELKGGADGEKEE